MLNMEKEENSANFIPLTFLLFIHTYELYRRASFFFVHFARTQNFTL